MPEAEVFDITSTSVPAATVVQSTSWVRTDIRLEFGDDREYFAVAAQAFAENIGAGLSDPVLHATIQDIVWNRVTASL